MDPNSREVQFACAGMKSLRRILPAIIVFASRLMSASGEEFAIHDGDRVVFLGDSITQQELHTTYIEAYAHTRFPNWRLTFRNAGWGGDTSWLRTRFQTDESKLFAADEAAQLLMIEKADSYGLERDVLPLKPTLVTVEFGMNDHGRQAFREDMFHAYVRSQTQIAKLIESRGVRVIFLTPQPIEYTKSDTTKDVCNLSLRKFSDGLKTVASDTGAGYIDQFDPYMAILARERVGNPPAFIGGGNAAHPGPPGHLIKAWALLKGMGATAQVSDVDIDASQKKLISSGNCKVSNLTFSDRGLTFDRLDNALPMPIDAKAEPALKLAPILDELDRYDLRITGLPKASYEVRIDHELVGTWSNEDLSRGLNLADQAGPITRQAREALHLIIDKNWLYFHRWREVQLFEFPKWAEGSTTEMIRSKELKRLDGKIADSEAAIHQTCIPKLNHFELRVKSK